ncbi:hypothetical protein GCM10027074_69980 [Streptomyces deserti]
MPITAVPARAMSGKRSVVNAVSLKGEGRSGPDDDARVGAWLGNCFTEPQVRIRARGNSCLLAQQFLRFDRRLGRAGPGRSRGWWRV